MVMATPSKVPFKRVPGEIKPIGKFDHEAAKFKKDIENKTIPELKDLLSRQESILSNSRLLKTLPDEGEKVRQKKRHIEVSYFYLLLCIF